MRVLIFTIIMNLTIPNNQILPVQEIYCAEGRFTFRKSSDLKLIESKTYNRKVIYAKYIDKKTERKLEFFAHSPRNYICYKYFLDGELESTGKYFVSDTLCCDSNIYEDEWGTSDSLLVKDGQWVYYYEDEKDYVKVETYKKGILTNSYKNKTSSFGF